MTAYLVQGPQDMFATKFVGLTPGQFKKENKI